MFLVAVATDDRKFNRRAYEITEVHEELCDAMDNAELHLLVAPIVVDRDPMKTAISNSGTSPALVRKWQQIIETLVPLHTGRMAQTVGR